MRPHERLEVWQTAVDLVIDIYDQTHKFPFEERFGLTSQMRKAAVSVPANIAEGGGRRSSKEFVHFLSNAQGSASELSTELVIAKKLGYIQEEVYMAIQQKLDSVGRMIVGLSRSLNR